MAQTNGTPDRRVALHQAALPPRRARDWLDAVLHRLDAARVIQALPEQQVYFAVRELGPEDALELLRLCSPEQVRACLDIDCWHADRLDPVRMLEWLALLGDLGPQRLARIVEALDHEVLVTFLQHYIRVYDKSIEDEPTPEEPEGHFYETPDGFYLIDVRPEAGAAIDRLLDTLYAADLTLARRMVMGARWDIGAESEETAYRFRSGRMADLGYPEYYEALPIYNYLDPASVRLSEHTTPPLPEAGDPSSVSLLPAELEGSLYGGPHLLGRVLLRLAPAQREYMMAKLLVLLNRAMAADRIEPGDLARAREVMERTAGYLSLALEYLARPEAAAGVPGGAELSPEGRAFLALHNVSLDRLFRLGYSLTLQLSRLCRLLSKDGLVTLVPPQVARASLLMPPLSDVVHQLLEPRPLASRLLLDGEDQPGGRPFRSLRDISRTALAVEEIRLLCDFLTTGLGLRLDTLPQAVADKSPTLPEVRLHDLLGTMVANLLLSRPPALVPLHRADLPALRQAALGLSADGPAPSPAARTAVMQTLRARVAERSLGAQEAEALWPAAVDRFVNETLERLGRSLAALPPDLSPEQADAVAVLPGVILS